MKKPAIINKNAVNLPGNCSYYIRITLISLNKSIAPVWLINLLHDNELELSVIKEERVFCFDKILNQAHELIPTFLLNRD